jgi:hypothetical protein
MNLQDFRIEKTTDVIPDWLVFGRIEDDNNIEVASFDVDGTSVNSWWNRQDDGFQLNIMNTFVPHMAYQIVGQVSSVNFQEFRIERNAELNDWIVFGNIEDNDGNILGTFGEDGTGINSWWIQQDESFQYSYVMQFATYMAREIMMGTAE